MIEYIIIAILLIIIAILCSKEKERKGKVVVHNPPEFTKTKAAPPPRCIKTEKQIIEIKSEYIVGIRSYQMNYPAKVIIRELCEGLMDEILKNDAISVNTTDLGNGEIKHEASLFIALKGE